MISLLLPYLIGYNQIHILLLPYRLHSNLRELNSMLFTSDYLQRDRSSDFSVSTSFTEVIPLATLVSSAKLDINANSMASLMSLISTKSIKGSRTNPFYILYRNLEQPC